MNTLTVLLIEVFIVALIMFGGLAYLGVFKAKPSPRPLPVDWRAELKACPICSKQTLVTQDICLACKNDQLFASVGMNR